LAFAAENVFDGNGIQHEIGLYYHVAWPAALAPDDLQRGKEIDTGSAGWPSGRSALSGSSLPG